MMIAIIQPWKSAGFGRNILINAKGTKGINCVPWKV